MIEGQGHLQVRRTATIDQLRAESADFNQKYQQNQQVWAADDLAGMIQTERYFAATHDAGSFAIDPLRYAMLLRRRIGELGGNIFERTAARSLSSKSTGWQVRSQHGEVNCAQLVLSQNLDPHRIYPQLARAVLPVATYIGAFSANRELLDSAITFAGTVADDRRAGDYFRRVDNSLIWGGRISTLQREPGNLAALLHRDMVDVFPQLQGLEPAQQWMGLMGYTRLKMPIIGQLEENLWAATGFGGHGLNTTAMAGNLIAAGIAQNDDLWRLFKPFHVSWGGGTLGRAAAQASYWWMQWRDRRQEARHLPGKNRS